MLNFKNRYFGNKIILITAFVISVFTSACGKSVRLGELPTPPGDSSINSTDGTKISSSINCDPSQTLHWEFKQPEPNSKGSVDLLFVVDTSESLIDKRPRVASSISSFIHELRSDVDYKISVMLAHGGASPYTGALYAAPGSNSVLDSKSQSIDQIQSHLENSLKRVVPDKDEANGEMMIYSLMKSLESEQFSKIQQQGFYREKSALSIVFVSDENDVCYPPELHGFKEFPDFTPAWNQIETTAYQQYCSPLLNTSQNIIDLALARLKSVKKDQPLSLGSITHVDPLGVPRKTEESIGHGIIELTQKMADPVLIDIGNSSYSAGLAKLGNIVTTQLDLLTQFLLDGQDPIQSDSVTVQVDNKLVPYTYDSNLRTIQVESSAAGHAGSIIHVTACRPS